MKSHNVSEMQCLDDVNLTMLKASHQHSDQGDETL